jgi:hypothetical protein
MMVADCPSEPDPSMPLGRFGRRFTIDQIVNRRSAIRNPQSAIGNQQSWPRAASSLRPVYPLPRHSPHLHLDLYLDLGLGPDLPLVQEPVASGY